MTDFERQDRDFPTRPSAEWGGDFAKHLPAPGEILEDKWVLGELIGQGGMGMVYAAEHQALGRRVAIKFLRPEEADSPAAIKRFLREARVAGLADHPGIARVLDLGETRDGVPFLVMEYLEGDTLRDLMRGEQPLSLVRGLDILADALDTLQFIHDKGLVHRDMKPANLFVTEEGGRTRTKVLDFGIARSARGLNVVPDLTDKATVVGTPFYISPEQARSMPDVGPPADLWAMGVILYHLATGRRPFSGNSGVEVYAKVLMAPVEPPRRINPDLPEAMDRVVAHALVKDPKQRYSSAAVMARDLRQIADELRDGRPDAATPRAGELHPESPLALETQRAEAPAGFERLDPPPPETEPEASAQAPTKAPRRWVGAAAAAVLAAAVGVTLWLAAGPGQQAPSGAEPTAQPVPDPSAPTPGAEAAVTVAADDLLFVPAGVAADAEPVQIVWTPFKDKAHLLLQARWILAEFAAALKRPVKLVIPVSYDEAIGKVLRDEVDFASLSPNSYVLARQRDPNLELIARHLIDGGPWYQALAVTAVGSQVSSLADLKGRSVCFVDPASTSGYLYPRLMLRQAGLDPDKDLGKAIFTGNHHTALTRMRAGECAAAMVASSELNPWMQDVGARMGQFRILATSEPIPGDAIVIRHDLPEELKAALRRGAKAIIARTGRGEVPPESLVTGFTETIDSDYDSIRKATRERP